MSSKGTSEEGNSKTIGKKSQNMAGIKRRKPRSQREGRNFVCLFCQKAYFRSNALNYHVKVKHSDHPQSSDFLASFRQRRPKGFKNHLTQAKSQSPAPLDDSPSDSESSGLSELSSGWNEESCDPFDPLKAFREVHSQL